MSSTALSPRSSFGTCGVSSLKGSKGIFKISKIYGNTSNTNKYYLDDRVAKISGGKHGNRLMNLSEVQTLSI